VSGISIRLYTVPGCGRCDVVKNHLAGRGHAFEEVSVEGNLAALRRMVRQTGSRTVPVTQVGEEFVVGPDLTALDRLLAHEAGS
jgi:glutaredoxin